MNLINPFGQHFCRPCDRRHSDTQMSGDEMSLTRNRLKEQDRKSELVLGSTYQIWMGTKQLGSKFWFFANKSNVRWWNFLEKYKTCVGYVPISSSAPRPLGVAYVPFFLSEVEREQRPSWNGNGEAIVVGDGFCDGEGERGYTAYAPHYNTFATRTNVFSCSEDVSATKTFRSNFDLIPFDPCKWIKGFDLCPFDQKNSTFLQPLRTLYFQGHRLKIVSIVF